MVSSPVNGNEKFWVPKEHYGYLFLREKKMFDGCKIKQKRNIAILFFLNKYSLVTNCDGTEPV